MYISEELYYIDILPRNLPNGGAPRVLCPTCGFECCTKVGFTLIEFYNLVLQNILYNCFILIQIHSFSTEFKLGLIYDENRNSNFEKNQIL